MRTGEACALQWSDVEEDSIRIQSSLWDGKRKATKAHQSRRVLSRLGSRRSWMIGLRRCSGITLAEPVASAAKTSWGISKNWERGGSSSDCYAPID